MEETIKALKAVLPKLITTAISVKFWLCLVVIIGGLVRGGPEGFAAVIAALGYYCGTKAYQNVQFAKLNGDGKDKLVSSDKLMSFIKTEAARRAAAGATRHTGEIP